MEAFFISKEDRARFNDVYFTRHLFLPGEKSKAKVTTTVIADNIKVFRKAASNPFQRAVLIRADEHDGLSWACERMARSVASDFPEWNLRCFKGETLDNGFPEITKYVTKKALVKAAWKAAFLAPPSWRRHVKTGVLFFLAVALSFLSQVAGSLPSNEHAVVQVYNQIRGWIPGVILVLVDRFILSFTMCA
jgi:hypothetical protein